MDADVAPFVSMPDARLHRKLRSLNDALARLDSDNTRRAHRQSITSQINAAWAELRERERGAACQA